MLLCNGKKSRYTNIKKNLIEQIQTKISPGNSKVPCPNVNLTPIKTCNKACGCCKFGECYALKAEAQYEEARLAWKHNTDMVKTASGMIRYFSDITLVLNRNKTKFFRWHCAGDCPIPEYVDGVIETAIITPGTKHLIFTKRYKWFEDRKTELPENLTVIFSAWPGFDIPENHGFRVAWLRDEKQPDERITADAITCPGLCDFCGMCWSLNMIGRDVIFDKH